MYSTVLQNILLLIKFTLSFCGFFSSLSAPLVFLLTTGKQTIDTTPQQYNIAYHTTQHHRHNADVCTKTGTMGTCKHVCLHEP